MLLNKLFITKVQHEHICSNIISRIYSRSKNNCFEGHVLVAASKHDENCPITFIPSTSPCHILSYSNSGRKSIIGEINFFYGQTRVQKLVDWQFLGYSPIFLSLQFYLVIFLLTISLKRET